MQRYWFKTVVPLKIVRSPVISPGTVKVEDFQLPLYGVFHQAQIHNVIGILFRAAGKTAGKIGYDFITKYKADHSRNRLATIPNYKAN